MNVYKKRFSFTLALTVTLILTLAGGALADEGIMRAQIFSTAYAIEPDDGEMHPVAFIFNGGPGSSSIYLHMGGLALIPRGQASFTNKDDAWPSTINRPNHINVALL